MKCYMGIGLVIIYCLFGAGVLQAEEFEDFRQCAAIDKDASRLACYDRTMTRLLLSDDASNQQSANDSPVASTEQIAPVAEPPARSMASVGSDPTGAAEETSGLPEYKARTSDDAPDASSTPTQITEQIAPVAEPPARSMASVGSDPTGAAEETFGLSKYKARTSDDAPDASSTPTQITAIVTEVTRRPHGEHVVVLDNGQIWKEEFSSTYFPVEVGDSVTIKKRMLSGYSLVTPSGKGYSIERVR